MKTPLTKTKLIALQVAQFLNPRPCLYPPWLQVMQILSAKSTYLNYRL